VYALSLPAAPTAVSALSTSVRAAACTRRPTYTASSPRALMAALCMAGESEWATGVAQHRQQPGVSADLHFAAPAPAAR